MACAVVPDEVPSVLTGLPWRAALAVIEDEWNLLPLVVRPTLDAEGVVHYCRGGRDPITDVSTSRARRSDKSQLLLSVTPNQP
jgi:hypothetical protein